MGCLSCRFGLRGILFFPVCRMPFPASSLRDNLSPSAVGVSFNPGARRGWRRLSRRGLHFAALRSVPSHRFLRPRCARTCLRRAPLPVSAGAHAPAGQPPPASSLFSAVSLCDSVRRWGSSTEITILARLAWMSWPNDGDRPRKSPFCGLQRGR